MTDTIARYMAMRAARGISLREAARQIGVSPAALSRYENGDDRELSPRTNRLIRFWLGDDVESPADAPAFIPMPVNVAHARMMYVVADRYLQDNGALAELEERD